MKKTTRTILAFDDRQIDYIKQLRQAFAAMAGEQADLANKDMFLIAMGVGFHAKNKLPDFKRSNTGVRIQYFNAEDNVLFAALQITETNDPKSLMDIEDLYDLAELYAGGGVKILWNYLQNERDFGEWFAGYMQSSLGAVGKS